MNVVVVAVVVVVIGSDLRWNTGVARFGASWLLLRGDRAQSIVHLGEQHVEVALLRRQLRRSFPICGVHAPGTATAAGGTLRSPSAAVPSPQRSIHHSGVSCSCWYFPSFKTRLTIYPVLYNTYYQLTT